MLSQTRAFYNLEERFLNAPRAESLSRCSSVEDTHYSVDNAHGSVGSASNLVKTVLSSRTLFFKPLLSINCYIGTVLPSSLDSVCQNSPSASSSSFAPVVFNHVTTEIDVKLQRVLKELSVSLIDIGEAHKRTLVYVIS